MQLTVALAAEEAAGVRALRLLTARGHRMVAVLSDSGETTAGATVAAVARNAGIPLRPGSQVREPAFAGELKAQGAHLLLNVHSLHIVDPEVLAAPTLGAYNLHPGPLPERAGLHAPSWALYDGDETHAVSLHRMTATLDAGPIAFAERFEIGRRATALTVMSECVRRGLGLVERLIELAENGEPVPAHHQDLARRRWFGAGPPEGGRLDWHRPARRVVDFVRACDYGPFASPWGFPRCAAAGREVAIAAAQAMDETADAEPGTVAAGEGAAVSVAAADSWVRVEQVEVAGRRVPAGEVLRPGERLRPGREAEPTGSR